MTQKTKTYIALAAVAGVSLALMPAHRTWGGETAQPQEAQTQQMEKTPSAASTHGFMNGTGSMQAPKAPEASINVSGNNSKADSNSCGSNLRINADHESHVNVTIVCNNGNHNNIKTKTKVTHNNTETKQEPKKVPPCMPPNPPRNPPPKPPPNLPMPP